MHKTSRSRAGNAGGRVAATVALLLLVLVLVRSASAQAPAPGVEKEAEKPYTPNVAPASDAGERAIKGFRTAPGLKVELVAAEPLLAKPVSFSIDEKNRFFIAETYRYHAGVTDIRMHMNWLDADLASRTVEDRLAMYNKYMGAAEAATYGIEHDRIRRVEDVDGDGKADRSTVFADGFNEILGGIGAGILARGGDVWFTCIPDLWRLRDADGDGKADVRQSLQRGYGVHVGFLGHDLHGLRFGPDGKLYFSIGDRGFNVRAVDGRSLAELESGTVLRCDPDGSGLEVFASGLRNPQELAFDEFGNLFTCDNNSDSGDKARWVHVVEGGDSGWRIGYQFLRAPVSRGPWNAEKLWDPEQARKAAYLLPPLANISDGPSGLVYDPGTGMSEHYRRHFFLCDYRGASVSSGIRTFVNRPDGATFKLAESEEVIWGVLATDVDFGTDGALYLSDWVERFPPPGEGLKGRIYRIAPPSLADDAEARRVKALLAEGMGGRPVDELAGLLSHRDARVRQAAQFALAGRGPEAVAALTRVAREGRPGQTLARLHAIWALGQVGGKEATAVEPLVAMLADGDAEVRAQSAKVLGEHRVADALPGILPLLRDESPRVRSFAANALGKLGKAEAVGPILAMLRENADRDAYLRHAGVMGLTWIGDVDALRAAMADASPSVRMGVLLALRRLGRPEVSRFLGDADPALVLEAARAINDVPIAAALPDLAALAIRPEMPEPLLRRVINANFRLGGRERAGALAALAGRGQVATPIRVDALNALAEWAAPSGRDRVMGLWWPLAPRPADEAVEALRPVLAGLLRGSPEPTRRAAAHAAGALAIRDAGPEIVGLIANSRRASPTRVEALKAAERLGVPGLADIASKAADDRDGPVRNEALRLLAKLRPAEAVRRLESLLEENSEVGERQAALRVLGTLEHPAADAAVSTWLGRLLEGRVPPEIRLDLLDAASQRSDPEVRRKLERYEATRTPGDPLAPFRETLAGGNAEAGRRIFLNKAAVSCVRCHKVGAQGGEVGPDLTGVGARKDRPYLLEAIVTPSRQIAEGFESRVIATSDGQVHVGVFKADDGQSLKLMTAEGKLLSIPKDDIEEQKRGDSAMPDDLIKLLSRSELRDLIEFLARQKQDQKQPGADKPPPGDAPTP